MARAIIENTLRPAVELYTATICFLFGFVCIFAPWAVALAPLVSYGMSATFFIYGAIQAQKGLNVIRYRQNIRRLPYYELKSTQIPISLNYLFLGFGFEWKAKHTQRLYHALKPEYDKYVSPSVIYKKARSFDENYGDRFKLISKLINWDNPLNPVRPLPPVGGSAIFHGIELNEKKVFIKLGERVGHTLVEGTTRVGKTRLAEILMTQDIRRGGNDKSKHEVVIFFDPKGDADILKRMYAEAKKVDRENDFYVFHLGHPEISARYNAIGRFGRISEVASRISGQLSGEGNSAAFKEFAWRFVNIIARALVALGIKPDYAKISRYVSNIDELFVNYSRHYLNKRKDVKEIWQELSERANAVNDRNTPRNLQGRDKMVVALEAYYASKYDDDNYDQILDGLRSAIRYDKTYFDKIVASLLPLLEKLTTGKIAELLSPDYNNLMDPRPIFDWQEVIRKRAIVYIGLDAMSDFVVASAVGNSMFADFVSMSGFIYKHGLGTGLPEEYQKNNNKVKINLHCDEFNELIGDEFIPLVNKAGGSGVQVTAYTQTISDIEARIQSKAKAGQIIGNFNTLIMLRVREQATAELLTKQLPKVDVLINTVISGVTDNNDPESEVHFTSNTQDRVSAQQVPMIEPSSIMNLPKGQAFALLEGGQLWKIRMPLPAASDNKEIPSSIDKISEYMRVNYQTDDNWWKSMPDYKPSAATIQQFEQLFKEPIIDEDKLFEKLDTPNVLNNFKPEETQADRDIADDSLDGIVFDTVHQQDLEHEHDD